jgi:hypothetical protein
MAFPVIATSATTVDANGATTAVTMPAGITAGDLLLVFVSHYNNSLSQPLDGGWEPLVEQLFGLTTTLSLSVYGKIAVGGDTCSLVASAADTVVHALRITGHGVGAIEEAVTRAVAVGTSPSPNPPSCTPNSDLRDRLWLEVFAAQNGGNAVSYQSTNFTAVAQAESANRALLAVASRNANAVTMNPGVMSMTASDTWVAATLSIPPAMAVAGAIAGVGAFSGTLVSNPLAADVVAAGGLAATLTSNPISTIIAGQSELVSDLSTSIRPAAALAGTAAFVSLLTTAILLDASIAASASITALLTTNIPIAATIVGVGTVSAELFTSQDVSSLIAAQLLLPFAHLRIEGPPGVSGETLRIAVVDQEQLQTVT